MPRRTGQVQSALGVERAEPDPHATFSSPGCRHQLGVHTVGGVIAPGEDLMLIVPREDVLVIEARVAPTDIDQLGRSSVASEKVGRKRRKTA